MKLRITLFLLILFFLNIYPQEKTRYDINPAVLHKTAATSASQSGKLLEYKNSRISMTLIQGGYFTLGTTSGISTNSLDDNCQLTFGHPYAMTSYPVISIDGTWYKLDEYFTIPGEIITVKSGDTLKAAAVKNDLLSVSFDMYYHQADQSIKLSYSVKNLDTKEHRIAFGLMYDPSIGKNGDGKLPLSGAFLNESIIFQAHEVLPELILWEKATKARGIGTSMKFSESPVKVIAGNWNVLYKTQSPDFDNSVPQRIYDLYLKIYFAESSVAPGNEKTELTSITLLNPDFSSPFFLRWDLPGYIALDNNVMFPQSLNTYLEIGKSGIPEISNTSLKLELPQEMAASPLSFNYGSTIPSFQRLDINAKTLYENKITEVAVKLFEGSTLVDEIRRYIMIPETPVSDTGLIVTIDTLIASRHPYINLTFEVLHKVRGTKIANLNYDNIFLYENNARLTDYTFGKDTSGGVLISDIVFVLDVTGSMGNEIDAVKRNIVEFADSLTQSGVDYQLGLVTFLDNIENIYPFTKDVQYFQQLIGRQNAHGGGDLPENSLQALLEASRFNFRTNSKRIVIWITDASYHESDSFTNLKKQTVIDSLLIKGITVHSIGDMEYKSSFYDPILLPTGGNYYNISGNFRDILLDISRVKSVFKYLLSYRSPEIQKGTNQIKLQIRYAGLGGEAFASYNTANAAEAGRYFSFYPNPFNPEITFKIKQGEYSSGKIRIYDILGRIVREFNFTGANIQNIVWNAKDEHGGTVGTGFYIAELTLTSPINGNYVETAKILYLK